MHRWKTPIAIGSSIAQDTDAVICTRDLAECGSNEGGAALWPDKNAESNGESWALSQVLCLSRDGT